MCGLWLWIKRFKEIEENNHYRFIQERGPDEIRIIEDETIKMVFYRLAIQDLSENGSQPFIHNINDITYMLMCNGEIYNYADLKNEYDVVLKSNSDCEIILSLFLHFNENIEKVLRSIRGEFAFVLIKKQQNQISGYVARDPYGVRPLFIGHAKNGLFISSLLKGISGITEKAYQYNPGNISYFVNTDIISTKKYYIPSIYNIDIYNLPIIYKEITDRLIKSVEKRLISDRPIGALLSGGLDSSLLVGIIYKILGKKIKVFTIGFDHSTDIKAAKEVIDHLQITDYDIVNITPNDAIESLEKVIWACETYDITTIRASIMQFKMAEYIKNNTDIKVIINGDGADELQMGYLYMKLAPTILDAEKETQKLLDEIHFFDGLRVDRSLGAFGLEARLPYLDVDFVDYFLSIPSELKIPFHNQEKNLIRQAFYYYYPDILPKNILFRQKEAFSDGVSDGVQSWHSIIKNHLDTDSHNFQQYEINPPISGESFVYRKIFDKLFNKNNCNYDSIIPHFWQPNFTNVKDPSARELSVYIQTSVGTV